MSSKIARSTIAAGLAAVGLAAAAATPARAAVLHMNLSDIHSVVAGVAGFDGSNVVSLGGADDFVLNYGGLSPQIFTGAYLKIIRDASNAFNSFHVTGTVFADTNGTNALDTGDSVTATLGSGDFAIVTSENPGDVLVYGHFNGAVLNTSVGSSTVNISSSNAKGLDLTPGPLLTSLGFTAMDPNESFALSVVGINPGVQVNTSLLVAPHLWVGSMKAFGVTQDSPTSGSVDMAASVPEPATLGLLGVGALALVARRRRPSLKRVAPWALAVAGGMAVLGGGTKAQAAVLYMNLSDINDPIVGVAGYDASSGNVTSLGGVDTLTLSGAVSHAFANASFQITGGFHVTSTLVADDNGTPGVNTGDTVSSYLGMGTFKLVDTVSHKDLLSGVFDSATLGTSVGSTAVTINSSSDSNNLILTPLQGLLELGITSLNPVRSFSINVVDINPKVSVSNAAAIDGYPLLYTADLNSFALNQPAGSPTSGSLNLVADATVPEPASLGLLSIGAAGLVARRRSRRA